MGDAHEMVIYHVGKVVGGIPVGLHDDEMGLRISLLVEAIDNVTHSGRLRLALKPHRVRVARRSALRRLSWWDGETFTRVQTRILPVFQGPPLVLVKIILRTEAAERMAALNQLLGVLLVYSQAL